MMGRDLRQMIADGAKSSDILGVDLFDDFQRLGFQLFKDESVLKDRFIQADFFSPNFAETLTSKYGNFDVAYAGSILHLFNKPQYVAFIKIVRSILKPGGVFFGGNVGHNAPGDYPSFDRKESDSDAGSAPRVRYLHSAESLKLEFEAAGFERYQVNVKQHDRDGFFFLQWICSAK